VRGTPARERVVADDLEDTTYRAEKVTSQKKKSGGWR